jgi:GWxTD domain-containing protein
VFKVILHLLPVWLFIPLSAQENISFDFDYAQFGYDTTTNYVEFYYSFKQSDLTIRSNETGFSVSGILRIEIIDTLTNQYLLNNNWKVNSAVNDTADLEKKSLVGVVGFAIPEGVYRCIVTGSDEIDQLKSKKITETIEVNPLYGESFSISYIQLASNIKNENVDENSIFYKNTLEVMPNPTTLYSNSSPVLFYYSELYNLFTEDSLSYELVLRKEVYDSQRRIIHRKEKPIGRDSRSIVEVGLINLKSYPTDSYTLILSLIDTSTNKGAVSTKKFYLFNPGVEEPAFVQRLNPDFLSSEFGVFLEVDCDEHFKRIKYIASSREIDQYESLDSLNAKREFLYNFWKIRDIDPTTPNNEFKEEYSERLNFVEARFKSFNKPGYKTDRGRVYLMNGEPDQIDRFPNETNMKPYEIWFYNSIEGGVNFVFGDLTGFSDYELLSSTKRGEIRDDQWTRRLRND